MTPKIRVPLSDDHPIMLTGLRNLVEAESDLEFAGSATNGTAALKLIRDEKPDIAVLDISMPELNGLAVARHLTKELPSVKLMLLTLHEDRSYLKQALDAGVRGYVLKRSAAESLVPAIRAVMAGGLYIDPAMAFRMFENAPAPDGRRDTRSLLDLTGREAEVLKLSALGYTSKEISRQMAISAKSVETYKSRGMEKLDLSGRAELVRYAAAQGWLSDI